MKKRTITVALTGLNNHDNPGPGVPVARALRESKHFDVRIIGLSYESLEPGLFLNDVIDKAYLLPYPHAGTASLISRLSEIHAKENLDVIIPNFDAEIRGFIGAEAILDEWGVKTFLPHADQLNKREKSNLPAFGKEYNVPVPASKAVNRVDEIFDFADKHGYPMVVKGKFYEADVAWSFDQAARAFHRIGTKWGLPIVLQKHVQGLELNVVALGDGQGNLLGMVPMRKRYITDKGKAWAGVAISDPGLLDFTRQLMNQTQWRGPLELEIIKDADGHYQIIEINPRFPAWVYLATAAGQNLPERLVMAALGLEPDASPDYDVGKMFIRYSYDLICDRSVFESVAASGEI